MEDKNQIWVQFSYLRTKLFQLIGVGSLRLVSHLYSDRLLDQDHYLDWLVSSVEGCDLENLSNWLLVQQVHRQDILQHGPRGRRLAGAVLEHLYSVSVHLEIA